MRAYVALALAVACSVGCSSSGGAASSGSGAGNGASGAPGAGADGGPGASDAGTGSPDAGTPDAGLAAGGGDWAQYRHAQDGRSDNAGLWETSQAASLTPLWTLAIDPNHEYVFSQTVLTKDLAVFTTAIAGRVIAVEAASGSVRWHRDDLNFVLTTACGTQQPGMWSSAAIVGDVVYVPSPDGHLYALSAADGHTLWSAAVADPTVHGEYVETSPSVSLALGKLYLGVASSAHCDLVGGRVVAVDLATHSVIATPTVPAGQQGGGVWASISVDEAAGRVYASTGNRSGTLASEPLAQSVVALDARTLAVVDHWQNPTALENCDFGGSPALFDGGGQSLVAATSKDGWLYTLRRDALSAGPVWKYQLAVLDPAKPGVGGDASAGWGTIVSPSFANGLLYAGGGKTPQGEVGSVVAFEPGTGAVRWKHVGPGYVIAPVAAVGDVLLVEETTPDQKTSTLEVLDARTGASLRSFPASAPTYGAPSAAHGLVIWSPMFGNATAFAVPSYR